MDRHPGKSRELTRRERAAIHRLVTEMCANYGGECGCLALDGNCYMLGKWETGNYCRYFQKSVLPLDPRLEASMMGRALPEPDYCAACGMPYRRTGKREYCSPECQCAGYRKKSRERMRKKRRRDGGNCYG